MLFDRVDASNPEFDIIQRLIQLVKCKFIGQLLDPDDLVLDVACGEGFLSKHYATKAKQVIAIDTDQKLIEKNKKLYSTENLTFEQMDALDLKFADNLFDMAICVDLIEHLSAEDGHVLLRQITRVLKPMGMLVIHTPKWIPYEERSENRRVSHKHEYKMEEFRSLLKQHFHRVIIFTRTDEYIYTGIEKMAWAFLAVCCGVKHAI